MRRRPLLLAAVLAALAAAVLPARAALAGGYCHTPATDGRGTTVTLREYCYNPTVLRVPAGGQVTFVNADNVAHPTVGRGSDWFADVTGDGRATVRFDEPGIYPYFCHEHIGMIGVVVVGDGRGAGGAAAPVDVVDPPAAQPATKGAAGVAAGPAAARTPWSLAGSVLLGLAVAAGAVLVLSRRRRGAPRPSL
jgi:plastocyanin